MWQEQPWAGPFLRDGQAVLCILCGCIILIWYRQHRISSLLSWLFCYKWETGERRKTYLLCHLRAKFDVCWATRTYASCSDLGLGTWERNFSPCLREGSSRGRDGDRFSGRLGKALSRKSSPQSYSVLTFPVTEKNMFWGCLLSPNWETIVWSGQGGWGLCQLASIIWLRLIWSVLCLLLGLENVADGAGMW